MHVKSFYFSFVVFGRSIHCLSKIGDELYIEALKDGVSAVVIFSAQDQLLPSWHSCLFYLW